MSSVDQMNENTLECTTVELEKPRVGGDPGVQ